MSQSDPLLMIPGPTNLPPEVREALSGPGFYHRGEQMRALLERCTDGLRGLMGTSGDVITLTSSGTGALEAAITSVLSPGDRVLAIDAGKFGERLGEIAAAFGAEVTPLTIEPGRAADPDSVRNALAAGDYRALLTVYNETSTGVMHPIREIAAAAQDAGALVICDCVSCLGGVPVEADEWGIDVVAAGSQKCLMLPPGLAFVGVREQAWEAASRATMPSYYFDLRKAREALHKGQTPYTPSTTLIAALGAALDLIEAEGREAVFARHAAMAAATRAAMEAAGLALFAADGARSQTVTAVHSPVDSVALVGSLRDEHNVLISGGQGDLKGRIFRIGHMGTVRIEQIERTLKALADGLSNLGYECDAAAMVNAARRAAEQGAG
ncbi:MAG: pyridoxal-phosphate-dependent aminotransferase family protein [Armatimonadota bacterium]|jgi:aspartate aminotransferase-like enzyme